MTVLKDRNGEDLQVGDYVKVAGLKFPGRVTHIKYDPVRPYAQLVWLHNGMNSVFQYTSTDMTKLEIEDLI